MIRLYLSENMSNSDPNAIVVPAAPIATFNVNDPDEAYALAQHGVLFDGPWYQNPDERMTVRIRSASVGDVLETSDGTRWMVAPLGFVVVPSEPPTAPVILLSQARQLLNGAQTQHVSPELFKALQLIGKAIDALTQQSGSS